MASLKPCFSILPPGGLAILQRHMVQKEGSDDVLKGNYESFPYAIDSESVATEFKGHYLPKSQSTKLPGARGLAQTTYVVNVVASFPELRSKPQLIQKLLDRIHTEGFKSETESASVSKGRATKRIGVVVLVNGCSSMHPNLNKQDERLIRRLKTTHNLSLRVFGKHWVPTYVVKEGVKHPLPVKTAFKVIHLVNSDVALNLARKLRDSAPRSVVPFSRIRQIVKASNFTRDFATHFQAVAPKSPTYLSVLDADTKSLAGKGSGFYRNHARYASRHPGVRVMSLGYTFKGKFLYQIAARADMVVREAMTKILGSCAYYPEPSLFIRMDKNTPAVLFTAGGREALESRNVFDAHGKDVSSRLFADESLVTDIPARVISTERDKKEAKDLKRKHFVQAMRGIAQNHLNPNKRAKAIYFGLDTKPSDRNQAISELSQIINVYDPITRMYNSSRFTTKTYDNVLNDYSSELTSVQKNLLSEACDSLKKLGYSKTKRDLAVRIAKASGKALADFLKAAASS